MLKVTAVIEPRLRQLLIRLVPNVFAWGTVSSLVLVCVLYWLMIFVSNTQTVVELCLAAPALHTFRVAGDHHMASRVR